MSINCIKISDRASEGIKIINSLPTKIFITVLQYVNSQMLQSSKSSERNNQNNSVQSETDNSLEELKQLVGIPTADFLLLIRTTSYILKRINTFIAKPSLLQKELREKVLIKDEAKIEAIVRLWIQRTKPLLQNLANPIYETNKLTDVAWKLNVQISSQCQQQEKTALAVLQLTTATNEDINIEMDHNELSHLHRQLTSIQNELDALDEQKSHHT